MNERFQLDISVIRSYSSLLFNFLNFNLLNSEIFSDIEVCIEEINEPELSNEVCFPVLCITNIYYLIYNEHIFFKTSTTFAF